jgi:hypothetical protein
MVCELVLNSLISHVVEYLRLFVVSVNELRKEGIIDMAV